MSARKARLVAHAVLLAFLVLATAYSRATPAGEGPDEPGHVAYVQFLAARHRLPHPDEVDGVLLQQVTHPPLYYALGALTTAASDFDGILFFPNPQFSINLERAASPTAHRHTADEQTPLAPRYAAVRALRLVSALLGLIVVAATYALGRLVVPARPEIAVAAAASVAFLPQMLFMHGVANNDALANPLGALILAFAARVAVGWPSGRRAPGEAGGGDRPAGPRRRDLVLLGVVLGLGLLTKLTLLAFVAVAGVAVLVAARRARAVRVLWRGAAWIGVPSAAIAGWWLVRNALLSGDVLAWERFARNASASMRRTPLSDDLPRYFQLQLESTLGRFGWVAVPLPAKVYDGFVLVLSIAGVGLAALCAAWLVGHPRPGRGRGQGRRQPWLARRASAGGVAGARARFGVGLLVFAALLQYASVFRLALAFNLIVAQGRYLFAGLAAFGVLFALGLLWWLPPRARVPGAASVALGWLALAVYALVGVLQPAFALPPALAAADLERLPVRVDAEFGDGDVRLIGFDAPGRVGTGDGLAARLAWETGGVQPTEGLVLFAQLLDADGRVIDQVDAIPDGGRYPSASWLPLRTFGERVALHVPEWAAPGLAALDVGWYLDGQPERRLAVVDGGAIAGAAAVANDGPAPVPGRVVGDAYRIPLVIESAEPAALPSADGVRPRGDVLGADGAVALAGYAVAMGDVRDGDGGDLVVTLYWAPARRLAEDYTVFVHLVDADGRVVATGDGPPRGGRYPTSYWRPGETVVDAHALDLGEVPEGRYRLAVGFYRPASGERLTARAASGSAWPDGAVVLDDVAVPAAATGSGDGASAP